MRETFLAVLTRTGQLRRFMNWPFARRPLRAECCTQAWRTLGADIAPTARVHPGTWMRIPSNIRIGAGSKLAGDIMLEGWSRIDIGTNVLINSAKVFSTQHDVDDPFLMGPHSRPIVIGDYVWVIHDVILLPGVSIGTAGVVATGAVVSRDVDDYAVVGGNPAKLIRQRARIEFQYVPSGLVS